MLFICTLLLVVYLGYIFTLNRIEKFEKFYSILLTSEPKYYCYAVLSLSSICTIIYSLLPISHVLWPFIFLNCAVFFSIIILYYSPLNILYKICFALGSLSVLILFGIICVLLFILFSKSWQFFRIIELGNFWSFNWNPQLEKFGVLPIIWGSLFITFLALIVAVPIAVISTTYIHEYLPPQLKRLFENFIDVLIAMPTVVYGYFAAMYLGPYIKMFCANHSITASAENTLVAGIVIGLMIIPFISVSVEQALKSISPYIREASFALGVTKSQTIVYLIWPTIIPAVMRGIIFAFSRAIGETMIIAMATGLVASVSLNPLSATTSLTIQIMSLLMGDQDINSIYSLAAFALSLILFIITFIVNNIGTYIINQKVKRYA